MTVAAQLATTTLVESEKYDGLLVDTLMLLTHRKTAHMAPWAYKNGGRPHLEQFFKSDEYDGTKESVVIPDLAHVFAKSLPDQISIVELGPGANYDKTSSFISELQAVRGKQTVVQYISLDFVDDYAINAAQEIANRFRITTGSVIADYTKMRGSITTFAPAVLVSWNSPIWNSQIDPTTEPDYTYASNLRKIGQLAGPNGSVVLTHFPANNATTTEEIYNRDDCRNAVLAIPTLIQRELAPKCKLMADGTSIKFSDIFNYSAKYDPTVECVSMSLVSKVNCTVNISQEKIDIKDGDTFEMVRSAKPSVGRFHNIASLAKGSIMDNAKLRDGTVVGHLLRFGMN